MPQGAIKKLSVSVLLDQDVHFEGEGPKAKRILEAPTPERIKTIHDLVAAAVGFETQRGDQLIVESLPFESTMNLEPPSPNVPAPNGKKLTPMEQLKSDPKLMFGVIGGGVVVLLALGFGVRMMMKKSPAPVHAYVQASLPSSEGVGQAAGDSDTWAPSSLAGGSARPALGAGKVEALTSQLRAVAQKDVQVSAGILRGWIREEGV